MKKIIYMDNAATTSLNEDALKEMLPYLKEGYGNPSSIYSLGRIASKEIEKCREKIANIFNADTQEIYFTSCGTESDNWAIRGTAYAGLKKGKNHIITSKIEHHAVLNTVKTLEKEGFEVTYLEVDSNGFINLKELESAIKENTALVSIMYANNEIGTIQDIKSIGKICREKGVIFHTDAVQAAGHLNIDVKDENIDLLSISGHKFHGPKGVGALYIKKGIRILNLTQGGGQERGKRPGTENVAGIVGMSKALEVSMKKRLEKNLTLKQKSNIIINSLLNIERSRLNGDKNKRLPGNINICFEGIEGESLLLLLDAAGICASSGSACTSGSLDPSHVLLAIGLPHEIAHGSLRLSLDDSTTNEEIDYVVKEVEKAVKRLREMSPLWERIKNKEMKGENI